MGFLRNHHSNGCSRVFHLHLVEEALVLLHKMTAVLMIQKKRQLILFRPQNLCLRIFSGKFIHIAVPQSFQQQFCLCIAFSLAGKAKLKLRQ